jgi:hypothetical protein
MKTLGKAEATLHEILSLLTDGATTIQGENISKDSNLLGFDNMSLVSRS